MPSLKGNFLLTFSILNLLNGFINAADTDTLAKLNLDNETIIAVESSGGAGGGGSSIENEISNDGFSIPADVFADRIKYAELMLSYMNQTVKPCDDFYEYACGNWKNVIEPHESRHRRNNLVDIMYQLIDVVDDFLQNANIETLAPQYTKEFRIVQQFYNSCLNASLYPMQKSTEYLELLQQIGGFPAVEGANWKSENFHWVNMSAHMSNFGVMGLINEDIQFQYPYEPYFKVPVLGFDIKFHSSNATSNTTSNAYQLNAKRMRELLSIYGVQGEQRVQQIITDVFEFVTDVLKVIEEFNEDLGECNRLSDLIDEQQLPAFFQHFQSYFEIAWLLKLSNDSMMNREDDNYDFLDIPCIYLYTHVHNISLKHAEAAANYLALKFLYEIDARLTDGKYQKEYCGRTMKNTFAFLFDQLYMQTYFNDEIRDDVSKMVKEIRQSLQMILKEAHWLDEPTREAALKKESTMAVHIGRYEYPEVVDRLVREIQNLTYTDDNYNLNNLKMKKFRTYMKRYNGLHIQEFRNKTKPLDLLLGMEVNSYYYNIDNAIYVLAGFLRPPTYQKTWPHALKFGTLGYLVGHEFTHGFDTVGANFDDTGSMNYWWSRKSSKVFNERSNCYVEHYQKYLIPEINRYINGNLTKDENIADGGGLREALMAYLRFIKTHNDIDNATTTFALYKMEKMPGLNLTPEQLFFLGFTQLWCSSYEEANYWEELSNEHTIDKYRALGALTNNADFAKAFNCPLGSKMHPKEEKCEVW